MTELVCPEETFSNGALLTVSIVGAYISHLWEPSFTEPGGPPNFQADVIDYLKYAEQSSSMASSVRQRNANYSVPATAALVEKPILSLLALLYRVAYSVTQQPQRSSS